MASELRVLDAEPGPGFCYSAKSGFCRFGDGFGPLLVAFDSNIISYLETHGSFIVNDEAVANVGAVLQAELGAIAQLLEVWRTRDIRFIALPQILKDFQRVPDRALLARRQASRLRIIQAMSYQVHGVDLHGLLDSLSERVQQAPDQLDFGYELATCLKPLDAQLVREALACEVDVFLTNDKQLRGAVRRLGLPVHALSSVELIERFAVERVGLMGEEHAYHRACSSAGYGLLCDDTGKWAPLFEILGGE